jgi:hypothetical protein
MTRTEQNPPLRPDSERYALEADVLRRRQLRAALLHGSARTWRDRRRIWPAAIAGAVAVAVIVAAIAVAGAFARQQRTDQQQSHTVGLSRPVGVAFEAAFLPNADEDLESADNVDLFVNLTELRPQSGG